MILAMDDPTSSTICTCIACGCDDLNACIDRVRSIERVVGCHWIRKDATAGVGVCSNCPEAAARFDAGDRTLQEN